MHIKKFCDILILKKTSNNQDVATIDNYKDYVKMIEHFIKKIRKINNLPIEFIEFDLHLMSKSFSQQFEEKIKVYNVSKFINWLFLST